MHHYANPKPAVEIVLCRDDKILISKRGINPGKGTFDMPGGFVELNESAEVALQER
jgi:NAD+ diphosphatase